MKNTTENAAELRRHARKLPKPSGDVSAVMCAAADELDELRRQMDADRVIALRWRADAEAAGSDLMEARAESVRVLDLVSRIRWALGDNGKRMQDELIEWCREIASERAAK
jgi:hypothetical protein